VDPCANGDLTQGPVLEVVSNLARVDVASERSHGNTKVVSHLRDRPAASELGRRRRAVAEMSDLSTEAIDARGLLRVTYVDPS